MQDGPQTSVWICSLYLVAQVLDSLGKGRQVIFALTHVSQNLLSELCITSTPWIIPLDIMVFRVLKVM